MNKEEFVTPEQSILLKKLGFDQKCTHYYESGELKCYYVSITSGNGRIRDHDVSLEDLMCSVNKNCPNNKDVSDAPTLLEAQKWLTKERGLIICICPEDEYMVDNDNSKLIYKFKGWNCNILTIFPEKGIVNGSDIDKKFFSSPEEALSEGITECLKILEKDE